MEDFMSGGGRRHDRGSTKIGVPGYECQIPIAGGTYYWAPPIGVKFKLLAIEIVVMLAVVAGSGAPTIKVGNSGDDDGFITAKTIATTTAAGVAYSTQGTGLTKGAFWALDGGVGHADALIEYDQPLVITATAGTDGGTPAGVFFVRVMGEWTGEMTNPLAVR